MDMIPVSTGWGAKRLGLSVQRNDEDQPIVVDPGVVLNGDHELVLYQEGPCEFSGYEARMCLLLLTEEKEQPEHSGVFLISTIDGKRKDVWPIEALPRGELKIVVGQSRFCIRRVIIDPHRRLQT